MTNSEVFEVCDGLENAFRLALNVVPSQSVKIGVTDDEAIEIGAKIIKTAQAKIMTLECVLAAIKLEEDEGVRNRIKENTLRLLDAMEVAEKQRKS